VYLPTNQFWEISKTHPLFFHVAEQKLGLWQVLAQKSNDAPGFSVETDSRVTDWIAVSESYSGK